MNNKVIYVALMGPSNVGKSTLVNRLIGYDIAIVTPKVQTTRKNIRGIITQDNVQFIITDTPGIFKPNTKLERSIVKEAWNGVADTDIVCMMFDARRPLDENIEVIIQHLIRHNIKACAILNKVDAVDKPVLLELASTLHKFNIFDEIFMISALKNKGIKPMLEYWAKQAVLREWPFPADDITDTHIRNMAEEITREQALLRLQQELPYSIAVETESWQESEGKVVIYQSILVLKENHKKMVIGTGATKIKSISAASRRRIEGFLDGQKVSLYLNVKVDPKWIEHS